MVGPPKTTAAGFKMPRLRRCPFNLNTMVWKACVDGGLDGYVCKVRFGTRETFALKVVSGNQAPCAERNWPRSC
jgi:hypothetical protein